MSVIFPKPLLRLSIGAGSLSNGEVVAVPRGTNSLKSGRVMKESGITGLSPVQVQDKFAFPATPTQTQIETLMKRDGFVSEESFGGPLPSGSL